MWQNIEFSAYVYMILTLLASSSWFIKVFIIWLHRLNFVFEKNIIKEWWHD